MKKNVKITAFFLTLVMLLGMLPFAAFAVETEPIPLSSSATEEDASILDSLALKAQGTLFTGLTAPQSGATVIYSGNRPHSYNSSKLKFDGTNNEHVLNFTDESDGSLTVSGKATPLGWDNDAKIDLLVRHINTINNDKRGTMDRRYQVFSTNIRRGESFSTTGTLILAEVYFDNIVDGTNSLKIGTNHADHRTKISLFTYAESGDVIKAGDVEVGTFGNETYTNFTVIFDSAKNSNGKFTYSSYINGLCVAKDVEFSAPAILTNPTLHSVDFDTNYTLGGIVEGVHSQHGATVSYYSDTLPTMPENAATGVFKVGDGYYYYQNGKLNVGGTVKCEGYTLTLAKESGRIVNVESDADAVLGTYKRFTNDEITASGGTIKVDAYPSIRTSVYSIDSKYKNIYNEDLEKFTTNSGEIIDFDNADGTGKVVPTMFSYSEKNRTYTFGAKLATNQFKRLTGTTTDANLSFGYAIPQFSPLVEIAPDQQFVLRQALKFGEGINSITNRNNGISILENGESLDLFRYDCYSANNNGTRIRLNPVSLQKQNDGMHLIVFNQDTGLCNVGEYTDIAYVMTGAQAGGKYVAYIDVYVNGVLVVENYLVENSASNYVYFKEIDFYFDKNYGWAKELLTYQHTEAYIADSYLEAITDGYTGVYNNGNYSIYYENGSIVDRGDYETLAATYGEAKKYAELIGYSVVLADTLHLNFYADLGNFAQDVAYATLTADGEEERIELSDLKPEEDGSYKFTAKLSSIQLASEVAFRLFDKDGKTIILVKGDKQSESYSYSIKRYCEYVMDNNSKYSAQTLNLVKAILIYGAYAECYFVEGADLSTAAYVNNYQRSTVRYHSATKLVNVNTYENKSNVFNLKYTTTDIDANLASYVTDREAVGEVYFVLDSAIKIRIALNTETAPTNIVGGKLVTKIEGGKTKYYVDIEGLTAKELNTIQVVNVDGVEIGITALAVANVVISDTEVGYADNFKNLMRALVAYYYYTDMYVKSL